MINELRDKKSEFDFICSKDCLIVRSVLFIGFAAKNEPTSCKCSSEANRSVRY